MTKANEIDRLTLLERDIKIQFDELRRLRTENERLTKENNGLRKLSDKLTKDNEKFKKDNKEFKARLSREDQEEKDENAFYIRSQREARGMGFEAFARLVGTTATTLRSYENGKGRLKKMRQVVGNIQRLRRG